MALLKQVDWQDRHRDHQGEADGRD